MSFAQLERSRQSGNVVELYKFTTAGVSLPTDQGGDTEVVFEEDWSYLDAAARDAAWTKESHCAAAHDGGATGGFGGARLHVGAQFGCSLGNCCGYARHVRTLGIFDVGREYTITCTDAERDFVGNDFLNYGLALDWIESGDGQWVLPDASTGTISRTFTAASTSGTIRLGLFDLEFGVNPRVLHFGRIRITTVQEPEPAPDPLESDVLNYTSTDVEIVYDGDTYVPAEFLRASPFTAGSGDRRDIEIRIPRDHLIAQMCESGHPRAPITVQIIRVHRSDLTDGAIAFDGQVLRARYEGAVCVLTLGDLRSYLERKKPSMLTQRDCAHKLYGRYCGANEFDFTHEDLVVQAVAGRVVRVTDAALISLADDAYFTEGKIRLENGQMEFIETMAAVEGTNDLDLTLKAPLDELEVGSVVTLTAGCRHTPEDCHNRFANLARFGGEPGMPKQDPWSGAGLVGNQGAAIE